MQHLLPLWPAQRTGSSPDRSIVLPALVMPLLFMSGPKYPPMQALETRLQQRACPTHQLHSRSLSQLGSCGLDTPAPVIGGVVVLVGGMAKSAGAGGSIGGAAGCLGRHASNAALAGTARAAGQSLGGEHGSMLRLCWKETRHYARWRVERYSGEGI